MTSSDWEVLFGDNDEEETKEVRKAENSTDAPDEFDAESAEDDDYGDDFSDADEDDEDDEETPGKEDAPAKKKKAPKSPLLKKPAKSAKKDNKPKKEKPQKADTRDSVHGLRKKEPGGGNKKQNTAKIVIAAAGVIAALAVVGMVGLAMNKKIQAVADTNDNLTQQIASRTLTVYVAKRDIAKGDDIVLSGDSANAELAQVYSSLSQDSYVQETDTGYAQVDIKAGQPIMANEIGDNNPVTDLIDAAAEVEAKYTKAKEMPYRITADFVETATKETIATSRDLKLDAGANEKAFNTEAEEIDGYVLTSIQVDGESVHAYGISEKSMKEGIVTMYYYTTKGGWGRHEIKGNIRVTYGYTKKDDPAAEKTDVFDDSAWIETEEADTAEDDGTIDESVVEAVEEALAE